MIVNTPIPSVKQSPVAPSLTACYNFVALGNRLAVGQRTLDSHLTNELVSKFLSSRRQGLSPKTIKFYEGYLKHSNCVLGFEITTQDINAFLNSLRCSDGGKHAYFRALRALYSWLYSPKSGYGLNTQDNPMPMVEPPKLQKRILPSLTSQQLEVLFNQASSLRDKCIIRLLADSGMRVSEITNIQESDIDWNTNTITIIGKGNRQRRAPFTHRTAKLLRCLVSRNSINGNLWSMNHYGIQQMLERLEKRTGIKCNPHSFRRGFACNLHRKGLSTLDIMHLGGWSDLSMVLKYTQSITFEDCLEHYRQVESR